MRYTIITGTGRAGTTLLVQVLTRVGLDTGYADDAAGDPVAHAGLERSLTERPVHRIVKSPWIALDLAEQLAAGVDIEHAIVCIRSLAAAAESRRHMHRRHPAAPTAPGGLWLTSDPGGQATALAEVFYKLVFTLTRHDIPVTFLHFPRFALDHTYAATKLLPVFPEVSERLLRTALAELVVPEWIRVSDDGEVAECPTTRAAGDRQQTQ